MRRLFSPFEQQETFIARGAPMPSFTPVLKYNNAGVECRVVDVLYMLRELAPRFFEAHWAEVGQDKSWEVDINWPMYRKLELADMLRIVVLEVDGQPQGYFIMVISPSLHYQSHALASSDMFYIAPAFRARYAVRLFRAAEAYAKEAGAAKLYIPFKIYKPIFPLLKRCGFSLVESVAVKTLR
jgi:GNAT superfamily N-acetyltransferase